jgi:histidine ammonia-lyase
MSPVSPDEAVLMIPESMPFDSMEAVAWPDSLVSVEPISWQALDKGHALFAKVVNSGTAAYYLFFIDHGFVWHHKRWETFEEATSKLVESLTSHRYDEWRED